MTVRAYLSEQAAIYEPAGPGGDGPYAAPLDYPEEVFVHGLYDYFAGATVFEVEITHPALPISAQTVASFGLITVTSRATPHVADVLLAEHNLGYVPSFVVSIDDDTLTIGYPLQDNSKWRRVLPYATDTEIRAKVISSPDNVGFDALTVSYRVAVFRAAGPVDGAPTFYLSADRVRLARGALDSAEKSLRLALDGEAAFRFPLGPTVAIGNGHSRYVSAAGMVRNTTSTVAGTPYSYDGSFSGSPSVDVVVI